MTHCNIIKDLLPLYVDGLCSEESAALVDAHLTDCPDCRGTLELFAAAPAVELVDEKSAFERFGKNMKKRNLRKIVLSTVSVLLVILVLGYLAVVPEFVVPGSEGMAWARIPMDGGLDVYIERENYKNAYANYRLYEDGTCDLYISVTDNLWTLLFPAAEDRECFVRIGGRVCASYDNWGDNTLFVLDEPTIVRNVYYAPLPGEELMSMSGEELSRLGDKVLVWENRQLLEQRQNNEWLEDRLMALEESQ